MQNQVSSITTDAGNFHSIYATYKGWVTSTLDLPGILVIAAVLHSVVLSNHRI